LGTATILPLRIPHAGSNTAIHSTASHTPYCVRGPGFINQSKAHAPAASTGSCHNAFARYSSIARSITAPPCLTLRQTLQPPHVLPPPASRPLAPTPPR